MQEQKRLICSRVDMIMSEMNCYIDYLYATPCLYSRNVALSQLRCKFQELQFICRMLCAEDREIPLPGPPQLPAQKTFTLEELAKFNGKNGSPAYVAVNRTVYDVTNNATWAAATHFGLSAGKDLSSEFAACHAGKSILNTLPVVGMLV